MTGSERNTRQDPVGSRSGSRPSIAQVLRQVGIIVAIAVVWGGLFAGFLRVTGSGDQTPASGTASETEAAPGTPTHDAADRGTPTPAVAASAPAAEPDATEESPIAVDTPAESREGVSYASDVQPILDRRCVKCHGGNRTEEGLVLTTYEDVMKGSWNGPIVTPGDSADSYLIDSVVSGEMPKNEPALLPAEIRLLTEWVDSGAPDN